VRDFVALEIPHHEAATIARIHAVAQIVESKYTGERAWFKARIPPHLRAEFATFIVDDLQPAGLSPG
jgi:hypothetical protein